MAFGSRLDTQDDVVSDINMVPLIDVMLVLLIIFMITVPALTNSVNLSLPRAQATPDDAKPETIMLSVSSDGSLYWNEDAIDEPALELRLASAARQQPEPEIRIRGDRKAEYEYVIRTMAAVQRAGIAKLGFVTEAPSESPAKVPAKSTVVPMAVPTAPVDDPARQRDVTTTRRSGTSDQR